MKHLYETFTDQEFEALKKAKDNQNCQINWHDFLMLKLCCTEDLVKLDIGTKLLKKHKRINEGKTK